MYLVSETIPQSQISWSFSCHKFQCGQRNFPHVVIGTERIRDPLTATQLERIDAGTGTRFCLLACMHLTPSNSERSVQCSWQNGQWGALPSCLYQKSMARYKIEMRLRICLVIGLNFNLLPSICDPGKLLSLSMFQFLCRIQGSQYPSSGTVDFGEWH